MDPQNNHFPYQPKVFFGIPTYGPISTFTMQSVCGVLLKAHQYVHRFEMIPGSYIDMARNCLAKAAADDLECTHLFFVDMDMVFLPETLERLLSHGKPVAGAWYCDKSDPPRLTAWDWEPEWHRLKESGEGLQEVGGVPMGCTLIEAWVLRKMREIFKNEGWFLLTNKRGEDVHFSWRLHQMGIKSYLDNDLKIGHLKEAIYNYEYYELARKLHPIKKEENGFQVTRPIPMGVT